jgi:DNA-binding protein HU-beta
MPSKADMVAKVAEESGITKAQAGRAVDALLDVISSTLSSGQNVTLSGFGTFRVTNTKARQGRNPATGAAITIPAGKRIGFSAGSRLNSMVKGGK